MLSISENTALRSLFTFFFLIVTSANSIFLLYLEEFPPNTIHPNASVLLFSFEEQQNI